jgi:hypothetical protein
MSKYSHLLYYQGETVPPFAGPLGRAGTGATWSGTTSWKGPDMAEQQHPRRSREAGVGHAGPGAPAAPTGWALNQGSHPSLVADEWCTCGAELSSCLGCGQERCLACDPYLSDDCRWKL